MEMEKNEKKTHNGGVTRQTVSGGTRARTHALFSLVYTLGCVCVCVGARARAVLGNAKQRLTSKENREVMGQPGPHKKRRQDKKHTHKSGFPALERRFLGVARFHIVQATRR